MSYSQRQACIQWEADYDQLRPTSDLSTPNKHTHTSRSHHPSSHQTHQVSRRDRFDKKGRGKRSPFNLQRTKPSIDAVTLHDVLPLFATCLQQALIGGI